MRNLIVITALLAASAAMAQDTGVRLPYLQYPQDHPARRGHAKQKPKPSAVEIIQDTVKFVPVPEKSAPPAAAYAPDPEPPAQPSAIVPKTVKSVAVKPAPDAKPVGPPAWAGALTPK
jgi:hypothetical protein